ncbi:hypothetical protein ALC57_15475 [Trachymyrmex cornetzi]|uniref:THAP-type domain-containing protein n=1 Tax=Trachymyrmex cornetzi TaxID=471704 RepID=A0A151IX10_9HYME|nr:hypothetical protein ALC57_15475 [Trachymyrmex cornetzi]
MESNKIKSKRNTTYCFMAQCHNYKKQGISFHHFPKDKKLKKQWEIALKMGKCYPQACVSVLNIFYQKISFFKRQISQLD